MKTNNGSALIMVLWSLVLISFLAGQYLDHNRGKGCLAGTLWDSVKQQEAVESVLALFATDSWPIPGREHRDRAWINLSPGGIDLWVKVENESDKININTAADQKIREKILEFRGEEHLDEAEQLTDAILDWRDADTLVRTNGAEADFYNSLDPGYRPTNGPFKVLTELLLVRGINRDLFWGNPIAGVSTEKEDQEIKPTPLSLLDAFTIYPGSTRRISVLVPGKQKGYTEIIAFLEKKKGRWEIVQLYRTMGLTSRAKSKNFNHTEPGVES